MKIKLAHVFVNDQAHALQFYTEVLRFVKKADFPAGEYRWLTVISPEAPAEMELLLEPNAHPASKAYQEAIFTDSIPATAFFVEDIEKEYMRLKDLGVVFQSEPRELPGGPKMAVFDDTCGNLIQLVQG